LLQLKFIDHRHGFYSTADPHLPAIHDDFFLQREKFLRECAEAFSAPHRNSERDAQVFSRKFLNIVDPLKQSNNLGRSVSKGIVLPLDLNCGSRD
jgi:hypothetical protein